MHGVGGFVRRSLTLGGSIVSPDEMRGVRVCVLFKVNNNIIPYDFFQTSLVLFLTFFSIYILLSSLLRVHLSHFHGNIRSPVLCYSLFCCFPTPLHLGNCPFLFNCLLKLPLDICSHLKIWNQHPPMKEYATFVFLGLDYLIQ